MNVMDKKGPYSLQALDGPLLMELATIKTWNPSGGTTKAKIRDYESQPIMSPALPMNLFDVHLTDRRVNAPFLWYHEEFMRIVKFG